METSWCTNRALRTFLQENGTKGIMLVQFAHERLGEDASHAAINGEIRRRRGHAYSDRHLRRLSSERQRLIASWSAEHSQRGGEQGGDIFSESSVYMESSFNTDVREQAETGEVPHTVLGSKHEPPAPTPAHRLPKRPTVADIPAFELTITKATVFEQQLIKRGFTARAERVRQRIIGYQPILDSLYVQRDQLLKSGGGGEASAASANAQAADSVMARHEELGSSRAAAVAYQPPPPLDQLRAEPPARSQRTKPPRRRGMSSRTRQRHVRLKRERAKKEAKLAQLIAGVYARRRAAERAGIKTAAAAEAREARANAHAAEPGMDSATHRVPMRAERARPGAPPPPPPFFQSNAGSIGERKTSMNPIEQIQQIVDHIGGDVQRMQTGENPQFNLADLGAALHSAQQLTAEVERAGLGQLTADEEAAAAALLGYATETLQRMTKAETLRLIFDKQQAKDRVWLHLIGMLAHDREIVASARRPLIDLRPALAEARAVAARWRELARTQPETRRAAADLRAKIEASRNAPPPAPAPDRAIGDVYRLTGL